MNQSKNTSKENKWICDPELNDKAISIIQREDGNWKGKMKKNGKIIEVAAGKPEDVLQLLITHS